MMQTVFFAAIFRIWDPIRGRFVDASSIFPNYKAAVGFLEMARKILLPINRPRVIFCEIPIDMMGNFQIESTVFFALSTEQNRDIVFTIGKKTVTYFNHRA